MIKANVTESHSFKRRVTKQDLELFATEEDLIKIPEAMNITLISVAWRIGNSFAKTYKPAANFILYSS